MHMNCMPDHRGRGQGQHLRPGKVAKSLSSLLKHISMQNTNEVVGAWGKAPSTTVYMWTSEDNLWESVLFFTWWVQGIELRSSNKRQAPLPAEPSCQHHLFILFGWTRKVDTPWTSFSPTEQLLSVSFPETRKRNGCHPLDWLPVFASIPPPAQATLTLGPLGRS